MSTDDPEVTTVTSKGQTTVPSRLRQQFGLENGTKLMVVPTGYGLVLKRSISPRSKSFGNGSDNALEPSNFRWRTLINWFTKHGALTNEGGSRYKRPHLVSNLDWYPETDGPHT